mmetsp:Transcript_21980/g.30194  ORF Transcript_21980/g.30194 Transcript_21980/m.30194 type:complete len:237 (+) Transcript_21980:233-943(+)
MTEMDRWMDWGHTHWGWKVQRTSSHLLQGVLLGRWVRGCLKPTSDEEMSCLSTGGCAGDGHESVGGALHVFPSAGHHDLGPRQADDLPHRGALLAEDVAHELVGDGDRDVRLGIAVARGRGGVQATPARPAALPATSTPAAATSSEAHARHEAASDERGAVGGASIEEVCHLVLLVQAVHDGRHTAHALARAAGDRQHALLGEEGVLLAGHHDLGACVGRNGSNGLAASAQDQPTH